MQPLSRGFNLTNTCILPLLGKTFGGDKFPKYCNKATIVEMAKRPSSDMAAFRAQLKKAQHVIVLTGAGVSAESGVPTFRGAGGYWRRYQSQDLATMDAFRRDPSLVWEFYHYRRELMLTKSPNKGHQAIAECEAWLTKEGRHLTVITQNIDELHHRAGSKNVLELHGSLFRTRCMNCSEEIENKDSPICEALRGKGAPDPDAVEARVPVEELPRCKKADCNGLLRPAVVWFGENLDKNVLRKVDKELDKCDLCLVVGTSSVVYPAAMYAPELADRGVPVAEFNMEETQVTHQLGYHFQGPSGELLPGALAPFS